MIPFFITVMVDMAVGLIALSNKTKTARALAVFVLCLGLWQTELFILKTAENAESIDFWFHLTRVGMFFLPYCLSSFTWHITGCQSKKFKALILKPLLFIACTIGLANNLFFPSTLVPDDIGFLPKPDEIYVIFLVSFAIGSTSSLWLAIVYYRKSPLREKRRFRWLVATLSLSIICGGAPILIYIYSQNTYLLSLASTAGNSIFLFGLLYTALNYHLMDLGSALSRIIAYSASLGLILLTFFTGIEILESQVNHPEEKATIVILKILLIAILIEAHPRLLKLISPQTKKIVTGKTFNINKIYRDFRLALKRCVDTEDLENVIANLVKHHLEIKNHKLLISKNRKNTFTCIKNPELEIILSSQDIGNFNLHAKDTVIMRDELSHELSLSLNTYGAIAICPLHASGEAVGLLCIGPSSLYDKPYFRYDVIKVLELIAKELPGTIQRIQNMEGTQKALANAQKTLSVIDLMNQYHHEIKSPLSIIDGVVSSDLYDPEKQRQLILDQVDRGSQLISMMSAVFHEKREQDFSCLNIRALAKRCSLLFERRASRITYRFDPVPNVYGDADDLSILLINLMKNAVEAKREGQPLIITIASTHAQGRVWLRIEDNGCGIEPARLETLWDNHATSKATGSGIGLQAIRRIADEHGVSIQVDSKEGKGTVFSLAFPPQRCEASTRRPPTSPAWDTP